MSVVNNVLCHRLIQLETAQSNLGEYPSLAHYRNAASQRFDYFDTLLTGVTFCEVEVAALECNLNENTTLVASRSS